MEAILNSEGHIFLEYSPVMGYFLRIFSCHIVPCCGISVSFHSDQPIKLPLQLLRQDNSHYCIFRQKLHSQERHDNVATETGAAFHQRVEGSAEEDYAEILRVCDLCFLFRGVLYYILVNSHFSRKPNRFRFNGFIHKLMEISSQYHLLTAQNVFILICMHFY